MGAATPLYPRNRPKTGLPSVRSSARLRQEILQRSRFKTLTAPAESELARKLEQGFELGRIWVEFGSSLGRIWVEFGLIWLFEPNSTQIRPKFNPNSTRIRPEFGFDPNSTQTRPKLEPISSRFRAGKFPVSSRKTCEFFENSHAAPPNSLTPPASPQMWNNKREVQIPADSGSGWWVWSPFQECQSKVHV